MGSNSRSFVTAGTDGHPEEDLVAVDIEVPASLLADIDAYAATRGYATPDAVVREAIDRLE